MSDDQEKPLGASLGWKLKKKGYAFQSRWFNVRQDQTELQGKPMPFQYIEHPGAVFVVPVRKDGRLAFLRCYRYTLDRWSWELPAGGLGDLPAGTTHEEAARREMREEVGCVGGQLEKLGQFYSANGVMNCLHHVFLIRDVEEDPAGPQAEASEMIVERRWFSFEEALGMLDRNEIDDTETGLALLLAAKRLQTR